ncbi:MAG: RNA methyltransferase, partial [Coriobacteriia bacterium]|nr:RNA methyltransferase [Coriobacteriia bacterium]
LINGNDAQKLTVLSDNLFLSVSELKTSQGILGVFELPASSVDVSKLSRAVILEGVQDPKNVGALIRSAHCLGYDAVFLDECCAHPFSPKVIRASMGSVFCIPVLSCETTEALQLQIQELKDKGFFVVGTDVAGTEEIVRKEKIALLIGNEGSGLSPQSLELCDYVFRIKMASSAESLNAAVAGGIAMYLFNCDDVEL